ncbi:LysR family transcriptional regulator [Bifidobacterium eulemuris]|uniref:LysR family transcriptional regulator n=1 Tax=Bifidobacterium eulemuris TaxID=1765219 RepID=A0A261G7Z1_9BIFI|nr:LysR family transcriptional regulator [Bifidobacterium eulemuris]OZG67528.1 LysR family transcriptional regulator [Bifidobacterium eulemuris]QOL31065.1 LysR family transcriptional regulator [Bifidobacterium eulemuris]
MNLRVLRYFLAVVEEESITGAADILMISQPTLSRQLRELEEELGKQLFIRGSRTITLTPEGELLRDRAQEIIELTDRTKTELTEMDEPVGGPVFIGAGETDAMRLLAQAAKDTRDRYPRVRFHMYSGDAADVVAQLDAGLLDFAVLFEPWDTTKFACVDFPAADVWGVLMRRDDPMAARHDITADDLKTMPLLVSRQTRFDREFGAWGITGEQDLTIVGTYNLLNNAALMVSEGLGYALTLDRIINISGDSDLTFRPLAPRLEAKLSLVWKTNRRLSRAAAAFLESARERLLGA